MHPTHQRTHQHRGHPKLARRVVTALALAAGTASATPAASELIPQAAASCDTIVWVGWDGTTTHVYAAAPDGTGRTAISTAGADPDPTDNIAPAWSPDGTRTAWYGDDGTTNQIWVADPDGTNRTVISPVGTGTDPTNNRDPVWSPDGTRIAWRGSDGTTFQIYVADADGTNRSEVSTVDTGTDPTGNGKPVWSPDGTRIAWHGDDGTTNQIYVADPDGTNRTVISPVGPDPDPTNSTAPAWSPDGTRIAWYGDDGTTNQIWVADPDGTNRITLSTVDTGTDPTANTFPVWSPDGTRIAWTGNNHIWVADADGTNRIEVSTVDTGFDPVQNAKPAWSPDGTRIAWQGDDAAEVTQIWVADADGNNRLEIVTVGPDPDPTSNRAPLWRPRAGVVEVSVDPIGSVTTGDPVSVTVTVSAPCSQGSTVIEGLDLPCVSSESVTVSAGSLAGSTWTLPGLAAGASATATITGTVDTVGTCDLTATVASTAPALAAAASATATGSAAHPTCPSTPAPFTDVPDSSFARTDIDCIWGLGITTGTSATTYSPANPVTREQMASFLARTWRSLAGTCPTTPAPFTDVPASSFARTDIDCIYALGITTGTSATTYSPADPVTREQMAAFLARLWRARGGTCPTTPAPFTDVAAASFARSDIDCIYGLGITTGTSATTYSPANPVTREQMASFIARTWRKATQTGLHLT